jgi:hypothetical protein
MEQEASLLAELARDILDRAAQAGTLEELPAAADAGSDKL